MSKHIFTGVGIVAGFGVFCGYNRALDILIPKYLENEPYNVYKYRHTIMYPKSAEGNFAHALIIGLVGVGMARVFYNECKKFPVDGPCGMRIMLAGTGSIVLMAGICATDLVIKLFNKGMSVKN